MEKEVIVREYGDLTGEGIGDWAYLLGNPQEGTAYVRNLELVIYDGKLLQHHYIELPTKDGYQPSIFLGDFTRDGAKDVLVGIGVDEKAKYRMYYLYQHQQGYWRLIFDTREFQEQFRYRVKYLDQYQVQVENAEGQGFTIELEDKGQEYLTKLYYPDGRLKQPIMGQISPVNFIYNEEIVVGSHQYRMNVVQRIIGIDERDTLGFIETPLQWDGKNFIGQPTIGPRELFSDEEQIDLSQITYLAPESDRDPALEQAIISDLGPIGPGTRYYYNRIDLNDDGKAEVIVYLVGRDFCGTGGCTVAIFLPEDGSYKLLSRLTVAEAPIIVSESRTRGYRDLIFNITGGGVSNYYTIVRFTGERYPMNPSVQSRLPEGFKVQGTAIIVDEISEETGIPLA